MKKIVAVLSLLFLAGCGGNPAPVVAPSVPTPSAAIPLAQFLFASNGVLGSGPTTINDAIDAATGRITRITYMPGQQFTPSGLWQGQVFQTNSIYQRSISCVELTAEETRSHATPAQMFALQAYTTAPCWIAALSVTPGSQPIVTTITDAPYTWNEVDAAGQPLYVSHGTFSDKTILTPTSATSMTLLEGYADTSNGETVPPYTYCGFGTYIAGRGLINIVQQPSGTCK